MNVRVKQRTDRHHDLSLYMAPELALGLKYLTKPADIYSFAIIAVEVMVGLDNYGYESYETDYRL